MAFNTQAVIAINYYTNHILHFNYFNKYLNFIMADTIIIANTYCYCIAYPFNFNALVVNNFTIYYIHHFNYYHSSYIIIKTTNFKFIRAIIKMITTIISYYYSYIIVNYYATINYKYFINNFYVINVIQNTVLNPYSDIINFID